MSNRFSYAYVADIQSACENIANKFEAFLASIEDDLQTLTWCDGEVRWSRYAFREAVQQVARDDFPITNEELGQRYDESFPSILRAAAARADNARKAA